MTDKPSDTPSDERVRELIALIGVAVEALRATPCGRSYSFHHPVMDCPRCEALAKIEQSGWKP